MNEKEEQINISVFEDNNLIIIDLGEKPIRWLGLNVEEAIRLRKALNKKINKLMNKKITMEN